MTTKVSSFFNYANLYMIPALVLLFAGFQLGCNEEKSEPRIVTLDEQEAAEEAERIREEVSAELADGLDLKLWASERLLGDAIGINIDNTGRAFVTVTNRSGNSEFDIRGFRHWMIESVSWDNVEDRKEFLHRELSPERSEENNWLPDRNGDGSHDWRDLTVEKEEIHTIEDTTGDGIADRAQLYVEGFNSEVTDVAGAIYYFNDEVFLGVGPDMWRLRDTDGDGMADQRESISHGYAVHIGFSGHGMSGLIMGPDGRIYWGIGDIGLNVVDKDGKRWYYPNQGAILRSNPDGTDFEVFAAGVRNPHEFTFDKYGNLIGVDNDGDHAGEHERLVHLINGSDTGWRINWQFGKYVDPKNNDYKVWMDEEYFKPRFEGQAAHLLPPVAPYHSGPAGMVYNPGTALSEEWQDHFFVAEFVGSPARSAIHAFSLKPKGASFELDTDEPVLRGVLATGLDFGPDGALYFTDWIDGWDTKNKGRIWKLDASEAKGSELRDETRRLLSEDFAGRSGDELVSLLKHADMRIRTKAQFELVRRGEENTLLDAVEQTDHQLARIHGIWGIGQLARKNVETAESLIGLLQDRDPEIRTQAARILGDLRYRSAAESVVSLLRDDYARARMYAAEALGRMEYKPAIEPIIDMLKANNDEDVYLRQAGAIALARIGNSEAVTALHEHPSEAVRIAAVVALRRMEDPGVAKFLNDESEYIVTDAARAINDDVFIREAIPALARMLDQDRFMNEPLLRRAINANLYNGTPADAKRLASFAVKEGVPENMRVEALATLSVWSEPSTLDRVTGRYRGEIQRDAAVAREAVSPVISELLTAGTDAVQIAAANAVGSLAYEQAFAELFGLQKNDSSADVRVAALKALYKGDYGEIEKAIETALKDPKKEVRMAALEIVPELETSEERKVELLASVLGTKSFDEQQNALEALGRIQTDASYMVLNKQFDRLTDNSLEAELQLDLIKAMKNSNSYELHERLETYQASKNRDDSVDVYRESLWGGNADRGQQIFYNHDGAQCIRCHAVGDWGGDVGPNLSGVASRLSREQLLQALVEPGARIAPGYGIVTLSVKEGRQIQGMVAEESDSELIIRTSDGENVTVRKADITEHVNPPSAMPAVGNVLSRSELRDLVEFLSSLKEEKSL